MSAIVSTWRYNLHQFIAQTSCGLKFGLEVTISMMALSFTCRNRIPGKNCDLTAEEFESIVLSPSTVGLYPE
jgi:hypothetical protein